MAIAPHMRLTGRLLCVCLFSVLAVADIVPSNSSSAVRNFNGVVELVSSNASKNLSRLVPLTQKAATGVVTPLMGRLWLTTPSNANNASSQDILYMSCDPADYESGNYRPESLLQEIWYSANLTAAIFYSRTSDFCEYRDLVPIMQDFPIFSMESRETSSKLFEELSELPSAQRYFISIKRTDNNSERNNQSNPLGPSPSTAVAMIILYSITGIITALFLVIIITGAIRAHRHPDRYGPRDVLGRPRQSRARGLGRAILDTIPIVKFGEREPPKPADVELGSAAEARNATVGAGAESGPDPQEETEGITTRQADARAEDRIEESSGIAPAQPATASNAERATESESQEQGLGCSICTDEFEKGQDIRVLPCNHKFHPDCVDPWLLNVSGTCPLCRVDLRPESPRTSTTDDEYLAPPLQADNEFSHRRRSALRDILNLRSRPNHSTEERISALRRFREQRRNQSGELNPNDSSDDVAAANRRSRRISARISDVFGRGRRREEGENAEASGSGTVAAAPAAPESAGVSVTSATPADGAVSLNRRNGDDPSPPGSSTR